MLFSRIIRNNKETDLQVKMDDYKKYLAEQVVSEDKTVSKPIAFEF